MVIALLPRGTTVEQLAAVRLEPGLMSAGLGSVPAEQTYLDISQGNRVFDSLYDRALPPERGCARGFWGAVKERADSAPADIVPGLLQSTLQTAGVGVSVGAGAPCIFSPIGRREATVAAPKKSSGGLHRHHPNTFEVRSTTLGALPSLVRTLRGEDLLIAIERPPPRHDEALAIGVAGRGIDGDLTSDSTRTDGYVLSTDVAPTILGRMGIAVPAAMTGEPIRPAGMADAAAVESLGRRLSVISRRRGPVIGVALAVWLLLLALAVAASRGRAARTGVRAVGLCVIYLPLVLLLGAALETSQSAEQLLTALVAPLLALLTLPLPGYRAPAVASALTALAYAVDVVAGSSLTSLSLLGPNPGLGARFFGIGNELEALLAVLVVAGTGAALAGFAPRLPARRCAAAFLAAGALFAAVFAAGRFGADVGAAIVIPFGAATAAAVIAARRRRTALLVVVAPFAAVALLVVADLASGGNAHLTRSVLDAGGLHDLGDVAQRRLQLSAHSFARPVLLAFMPAVAAAAAAAFLGRYRIAAWLRGRPAMRAGLIGATAATLVGTLANDSGALLLVVGAAYLLVFAGFAWAETPHAVPR